MTIVAWFFTVLEIAVGLRCAVWLYDRFLRKYVESSRDVDDWEPAPGEPEIRVVRNPSPYGNPRPTAETPAWMRQFNVVGDGHGYAQTTLPDSLTATDIPAYLGVLDQRFRAGIPVTVCRGRSHLADQVALQARHAGWEVEWLQSPSFEYSGWRLCKPTQQQPPLH